jgi:L-fuculose-phosphate aldolase
VKHAVLREELIRVAREMSRRGLNQGTSGNVSARVPEGLLITPSALAYDAMSPDDVVLLTLDGRVLEGERRPSTEWRLHAGVLAGRPDVDAIVHAHATFCTTLACLRRDIPAFHYMVAVAGGDSIPCSRYATFGSADLAAVAFEALDERMACLLANHGMLALGSSPATALALALEVETLAELYWRALQAGEPVLLSDAEMAEVRDAFREYWVTR